MGLVWGKLIPKSHLNSFRKAQQGSWFLHPLSTPFRRQVLSWGTCSGINQRSSNCITHKYCGVMRSFGRRLMSMGSCLTLWTPLTGSHRKHVLMLFQWEAAGGQSDLYYLHLS